MTSYSAKLSYEHQFGIVLYVIRYRLVILFCFKSINDLSFADFMLFSLLIYANRDFCRALVNRFAFNSFPHSAAYRYASVVESVLVPIKACRLLGTKLLIKPTLTHCKEHPKNKFQNNINRNSNIFIEKMLSAIYLSNWPEMAISNLHIFHSHKT